MNFNDKILKKELIIKRRIIEDKLNAIKHGAILEEKKFSPITKHLKNTESRLEKHTDQNKKVIGINDDDDDCDIPNMKDERKSEELTYEEPTISYKKDNSTFSFLHRKPRLL